MNRYFKLIADAGSSKIEWALISSDGNIIAQFISPGINAILSSKEDMENAFANVAETLDKAPDEVFYYGAGCANEETCRKVADAIRKVWPDAEIDVKSDLYAAARSLLGNKPGIACILGTGSNSALYDGKEITANIPPLGFILGDEGSGTSLGKRLIKEVFKGEMPEDLKNSFFKECNISLSEILNRVYRQPNPNKFIASLVPFIRKHIDSPLIHNMVKEQFREFLRYNVMHYSGYDVLPVNFTGSVAFHFDDILRQAAAEEGISIGIISKAPMERLIEFHR
ncbi:MAG: ATPase [Muribaculaceae bacterium]|nr:ATPase [Muribaculaceae bacterium]